MYSEADYVCGSFRSTKNTQSAKAHIELHLGDVAWPPLVVTSSIQAALLIHATLHENLRPFQSVLNQKVVIQPARRRLTRDVL